MASQENIGRAVQLVDKLASLSDDQQEMIKERIPEAARGDNSAFGYVISLPYGRQDMSLIWEILSLTLSE